MLTIEQLRQFGANVDEGLQRCMGNVDLYLRLVNRFLEDNTFNQLKEAVQNNDLEKAFQCAHALKGVLANLSITPLHSIIFEMTDLLRNRVERDYSDFINKYENLFSQLISLSK